MFGFSQKVTDPVCKMKVDKNKTKYFSEYKSEKYYFCSENCLKNFNKEPELYVAPLREANQQENTQPKNCCH